MSVFHINFNQSKESGSYLGGKPKVNSVDLIPNIPDSKSKQKLLLTLYSDFFKSPILKEDEVLSIFISNEPNSINLTRSLAINDDSQLANLKKKYATVLIHKINDSLKEGVTCFPSASIATTPFSDNELKEETETPGRGSEYSKLNGIPGWIQDDIFIEPKYGYWLQLNEYDLSKVSDEYDGVFRQGIGYLFLNNNIKKMNVSKVPQEAGVFFIQF